MLNQRQAIGTLLEDIRSLHRTVEDLSKRMRFHADVTYDLRAILSIAHEIRGFLGALERDTKDRIASMREGSFLTKHKAYNDALKRARELYRDERAVDHELAIILTALEQVMHEPTAASFGVMHLLHELKRLEKALEDVIVDLRGSTPLS